MFSKSATTPRKKFGYLTEGRYLTIGNRKYDLDRQSDTVRKLVHCILSSKQLETWHEINEDFTVTLYFRTFKNEPRETVEPCPVCGETYNRYEDQPMCDECDCLRRRLEDEQESQERDEWEEKQHREMYLG